jgi:tryptophan-rich sensory protein
MQNMEGATREHSKLSLVLWIAGCLLASAVGAMATATSVTTWYQQLQRPPWTPPDGLFGPVWTVLYVTMGVAAWLVWREERGRDRRRAIVLFLAQLLVNVAWSWLFFGLRSPGLALVDILVLWALIVATTIAFARVRPSAALLLLPYLAWVSFAMALNLSIWRLNG